MARIELFTPTSASANQGGQKQDVISYRVAGMESRQVKAQLLNGTGHPDVPTILEEHPRIPGLLARSYQQIVDMGNGVDTQVDVLYATSNVQGTGLLYAVVDLTGSNFVWSVTFEDVAVPIPVGYYTQHNVSAGGTVKNVNYWEIEPDTVGESRLIIQAKWSLGGGQFNGDTVAAFEGEHDKLHDIRGYRYLFRVASIEARDNNTYEVHASWTRDKGTPIPDKASSDLTKMRQPHELGYWKPADQPANIWPNDASLMRSPFHRLETVPAKNPGATNGDEIPKVVQLGRKLMGDPNNLPGLPNL